jgi:endonuclease/exonuclease/phosphatase family metal-dependent hydrolase
MRVVTWNILSGTPTRENANLFSSISDLNADILAIQEVDHLQPRSNFLKTVEEIAKNCNYPHWAYASAINGTPGGAWEISDGFNTSHKPAELPLSYGIGLLSKVPVKNWHRTTLKKAPIGLPLLVTTQKGMRVMYVADEPRAAIAMELENGITVITSHLSFVPPFNSLQLRKIKSWAQQFSGKKLFIGDFNALIAGKAGLTSLNSAKSYPAWDPKLKFDFILSSDLNATQLDLTYSGVSDHLPIGVKIDI